MITRVPVHHLFGTCPKIEQLDLAPLKWIMGGLIMDIAPMVQLFDTAVIGGRGTYLGEFHHLSPIDIKFRPKIAGVQTAVLGKLSKGPVQVGNIIDTFQRS